MGRLFGKKKIQEQKETGIHRPIVDNMPKEALHSVARQLDFKQFECNTDACKYINKNSIGPLFIYPSVSGRVVVWFNATKK